MIFNGIDFKRVSQIYLKIGKVAARILFYVIGVVGYVSAILVPVIFNGLPSHYIVELVITFIVSTTLSLFFLWLDYALCAGLLDYTYTVDSLARERYESRTKTAPKPTPVVVKAETPSEPIQPATEPVIQEDKPVTAEEFETNSVDVETVDIEPEEDDTNLTASLGNIEISLIGSTLTIRDTSKDKELLEVNKSSIKYFINNVDSAIPQIMVFHSGGTFTTSINATREQIEETLPVLKEISKNLKS